jgi:hypothetical protein
MSEQEVLDSYHTDLKKVEAKLGKGGTTDATLNLHTPRFLQQPRYWRGVFALDGPWRKCGGYGIVNLEPRGNAGEHWIAFANGLFYDSFGRTGILERREKQYLPQGQGTKLDYTDPDPEQAKKEDNCGQRCIAWLMTYEKFGPEGAQLI